MHIYMHEMPLDFFFKIQAYKVMCYIFNCFLYLSLSFHLSLNLCYVNLKQFKSITNFFLINFQRNRKSSEECKVTWKLVGCTIHLPICQTALWRSLTLTMLFAATLTSWKFRVTFHLKLYIVWGKVILQSYTLVVVDAKIYSLLAIEMEQHLYNCSWWNDL